MSKSFDPNRMSFEDCLERLRTAVDATDFQPDGIVTSRDEGYRKVREKLAVENVPEGFRKWQLPVYLEEPSQMFVSVGEPDTKVESHSHDDGDGIRFIAGGSIDYEGTRLGPGDWMFIPAGERYSFEVGPQGAIMCYCYCCCCA